MRWSSVGVAALLALATASSPAWSQQTTANYKVVGRGQSIQVDKFGTFNPDCSSIGRTTINLVEPPRGGTVETAQGRDYPTFSNNNVRFQCDKRRLPMALVFYRARPDFTGNDSFVIEAVFGDGQARQVRYNVEVR